jgi:4-hydroxythreonine-4-phosphate dehydrogenase
MSPSDPPAPSKAAGTSLPLAVTMGDPDGIGLDITLSSWADRGRHGLPVFAVYGTVEQLQARARRLGLDVPIQPIAAVDEAPHLFASALPTIEVTIASGGGDAVVAAIEQATADVVQGRALALVTNPITKDRSSFARLPYPGHTEFLADLAARLTGGARPHPVMMLVAPELRVVPATVHIALANVPTVLTRSLLREVIATTAASLETDFGVAAPRIAVAGLNPHAGERGLIGTEEASIIAPVVQELAARGFAVTGPHSADTLFHAGARSGYDAVIAMYHDQALIPLKTLAFDQGVNVTLGLPFVRTSPDHGTAFDIAGTGRARPGSFIAALHLAEALARRRAEAHSRAGRL